MALILNKVPQIFPHSKEFEQGINIKKENVGTREVFVYPDDTGGNPTQLGDFLGYLVGSGGGIINFNFWIPSDFSIIEKAEIICVATTTATYNLDIFSDYGKIGEDYNNHDESNTTSTYALTINKLSSINIKGILSNITADDFVGIEIQNQEITNEIKVIGLRFDYR